MRFYTRLHWLGILVSANLFIYRDYWFGYKIFTGSDFFSQIVPFINYQSDCLKELSWPLWNPYMNFGYPWVEHYCNSSLFPTHIAIGLFLGSSVAMIQREILIWILLGGIGIYLCAREFGFSYTASIIAGMSFMFCSQIIVLPTWSNQIYNAASFPYLLLGYHKSKRNNNPFNLLSIAFLAMSILGGNIASAVLGIYLFIGYVMLDSLIERRGFFGIKYISSTLLLAVLLTLPKLIPLYKSMGLSGRMAWNSGLIKDAFNTVNFYNFMSFLLPVKYYFSLYIGEVSILALIYAIIKKEIKINVMLIMFILSAWLLMISNNGEISTLRSLANVLPLMKLVRNEFIHWYYPSIFAILYLSKYCDNLLSEEDSKIRLLTVLVFIALLSIFFFKEYNTEIYYKAYLIHIILSLLWIAATFLYRRKSIQTLLVVVLLVTEFSIVFNRVNIDEPPKRDGKYMDINLTHQFDAARSFKDEVLVWRKMNIRITQDNLRPTISESRKWPHLVSFTPADPYPPNWAESMNQKRFTGDWYSVQERFDFVELKNSSLLKMLDNQPLFQYLGYKMEDAVSFDKISCSIFAFSVTSEYSGFLLLRQMYDDRWSVFVDNKKQKPFRSEKYFMGAAVESGKHKVEFVFNDKSFNISLVISAITLVGISSLWIVRKFWIKNKSGQQIS